MKKLALPGLIALLALVATLAACTAADDASDGDDQDGGATKQEASSTDVCHKQNALCAWIGTGMCQIMNEPAVGGGVYKVEKIELAIEEAAPYYDPNETVRPRTVAYITMVLTAHIWGKQVDRFTGRLGLNDECIGVEDESYYHVGDEVILTLYPDSDSGTYKVFGWCVQNQSSAPNGKAMYGCIGWNNGLTLSEMQAVFDKAKKPDGTYDCTIPEGQCDYWLNPKDGGT